MEQHLTIQEQELPVEVAEIRDSLYVDELLARGNTVVKAQHLKESTIEIFDRASFKLHKWHSNERELETPGENDSHEAEESCAKQQLGVNNGQTKLLGDP